VVKHLSPSAHDSPLTFPDPQLISFAAAQHLLQPRALVVKRRRPQQGPLCNSEALMDRFDSARRNFVLSSSLALTGTAVAATAAIDQGRTDTDPRVLNGQPMPEPPPEKAPAPSSPDGDPRCQERSQ
jgi:hypothetical protein